MLIELQEADLREIENWGRACYDTGYPPDRKLLARIRIALGAPNDETYYDARPFDSTTLVFCNACGTHGPVGEHAGHPEELDERSRKRATLHDGSVIYTRMPKKYSSDLAEEYEFTRIVMPAAPPPSESPPETASRQ